MTEKPTALVTGATGFIGSHLVARLAADNWRVLCLVRPRTRKDDFLPAGVETLPGNLLDPSVLAASLTGGETIFHLAGKTKGRSLDEFMETNRDGTEKLLEAVRLSGTTPRSLVFVSSLSAAGPSPDGRPILENAPANPVSFYGRSKLAAEKVLLDSPRDYPVAIVRPAVVYGPRERDILEMVRWANRGIRILPSERRLFSAIHVDDLIAGLLAAAPAPRGDRTYFLCDGVSYEWRNCIEEICRLLNRRTIPVRISVRTGRRLARGGARAGSRRAAFLLDKLRELAHPFWVCSIQRARQELGFQPTIGFREGMSATIAWYRKEGWL